jgi:hypothetical protein
VEFAYALLVTQCKGFTINFYYNLADRDGRRGIRGHPDVDRHSCLIIHIFKGQDGCLHQVEEQTDSSFYLFFR